jgi:hypothetical protein
MFSFEFSYFVVPISFLVIEFPKTGFFSRHLWSKIITCKVYIAHPKFLMLSAQYRNMLRILTRTPRLLRHSRFFSTSWSAYADPWPLPHTPEHLESTRTPGDLPPPTPLQRPNESIETMRARLVYQSRKRGTLESDLLLSTFARDVLAGMGEEELKEYDKVRPLVPQISSVVSYAVVSITLAAR